MTDPTPTRAPDGTPIEIEMGGLTLKPGDSIDAYRYERPAGKGGMAWVLLARDPGGNPVALKVLKASRMRTGLTRFRREFRALSRLDHPNIIRVESWGDIHGHPYLAMEYIDGVDLHTAIRKMVRRPPPVRWPWVEDVLVQLLRALGHLSRRGLVHRDLKPSNVLITREGVCKLTDFGIVKDLDPSRDPFVSSTLVGTWAYASPEQIAGEQIDHRSDLYSLGIILYAMLTGRRPFAATDMRGYLEQHRAQKPTPPHQLDATVPEHLERVCMRLLEKSPRDRFQSASEVLEQLLADEPETDPEGSVATPSWQPPLVGRQGALDVAAEALARLTRSQGGVLLLEGPEGAGRSRLLDAIAQQARRQGLPVYSARFAAGEGAFVGMLRLARDVGRELGGDAPPELGRAIASFAQGRGKLPGDARYQLFDGVRTALSRLLDRGPQILALDDLQEAPGPLLDLLGYLVRSLVARDGRPLLVLAAARAGGERRDDQAAQGYAAFRSGKDLGLTPETVHLDPLSLDDVSALTADLLGQGPGARALATRLHGATGGDPLFVVEFVRSLIQRGVVTIREGGRAVLTVDPAELTPERLGLPPGLRHAIRERLAPLDEAERTLLEVIALAGREVDLEVVLDVVELMSGGAELPGDGALPDHSEPDTQADLPTEELAVELDTAPLVAPIEVLELDEGDRWMDALDSLIAEGLVVERGMGVGSAVDLAQRQIGEVVAGDMLDDQRAELHRRLAAALELRFADSPVAAEAIGEHYRLAGETVRAWSYLSRAAIRLLERSLLAEADALVERARAIQDLARAGVPPHEDAAWQLQALELDEVEAELLVNQGDWEAAARALEKLRDRALALDQPRMAATAAIKLGTVMRRIGRSEEGEALIQDILVDARKRHDRPLALTALQGLAGAAWARGDLDACERLASQGLVGATDPDLAEGRAGILLALTAVQASKGQLAAAIAGLAEAEELLRGLREKKTRANVLVNLAEMLTWKGDLAAAVARADEALSLSRDLVYRVVESSALRSRAIPTIAMGDTARARLDLEHGLAIARELGITEEEVPMRFHLGRCAMMDGDPATAETHLIAARAAAIKADPESFGPAIEALLADALARQGHEEEARRVLAGARDELGRLHAPRRTELLLLVAQAHVALGELDEAVDTARVAARTADSFHFRTWALRAWSLLAHHAPADEAARARATGAALARELLASLPPDRAVSFRKQLSVVRLLGAPLL